MDRDVFDLVYEIIENPEDAKEGGNYIIGKLVEDEDGVMLLVDDTPKNVKLEIIE